MSDQTKPTHISTSEDDVAKVDVEKLLFEIHQWCNRAYVKEDQYQSIRERIVLLAKERDEAVRVADHMSGLSIGMAWGDIPKLKTRAEKAEGIADTLQREVIELEKDKDTLMTALDGYKEATNDQQRD